jgi:hypothetical protein
MLRFNHPKYEMGDYLFSPMIFEHIYIWYKYRILNVNE